MELALSDLVVVEVRADDACLPSLVDQKDHPEHLGLELLVTDGLSRDGEGVAEKLLWVLGCLDCLLNGVDTAG